MKIKFKSFTTKGKIVLLSGALVLVGGSGYAIGKNANKNSKANGDTNTSISNEANIDVTTELEMTTEATVENTVASDNQIYYDEITKMEENIVDFCEDSLPNGFIEVNESNKEEMAELFVNAYIQINRNVSEPKTLAVLDQDLELIPSEISRDFMEFSTNVARYYQIVTPETELPFDKLIKDENDLEFITNLSNKIAEMNVCTDSESRQEKINEVVEIKESLLTDSSIVTNYNSETLYLATKMIIYADATAKAYGQEIITEEESEMQLYSAFYNVYCDEVVSSGYIEGTEVIDREVSSQSAFESKYLSTSADVLNNMIEKVADYDAEFDNSYSYGEVTKRVSEKIVGLYVKPEQTHIEKENAIREQTSNSIDSQTINTQIVTQVTPDKVPTSEKEADKVEIKDTNNNPSNDDYMKGLAAGRGPGSDAAWSQQTSTGTIPGTISSSQAPTPGGGKSQEYIRGYKEGYAQGWNNYVASAKAAQSTPTTEYVPVDNGEETKTSETQPQDVPYEEEEEFIPVSNNTNSIKLKLMAMRENIVSTYTYAYNDTLEEGVKKM